MSSTMFQKSGWRDAASSAKDGSRSARWIRLITRQAGQFGWGQSCWMPLMILVKQAPERAQDRPGDLARPTAVRNRIAQKIGEGLAEEAQV